MVDKGQRGMLLSAILTPSACPLFRDISVPTPVLVLVRGCKNGEERGEREEIEKERETGRERKRGTEAAAVYPFHCTLIPVFLSPWAADQILPPSSHPSLPPPPLPP
jgi:hypothetical protein